MVTRPKVQEQCIYKRKKTKIQVILTTSLISTLPLTKCPTLTLPLSMTTLISKTTPLFCHE